MMMIKSAPYRAKQFFSFLNPQVAALDLDMVKVVFGSNQAAMALFNGMSTGDQQHALAVLHTLQSWGDTPRPLQQAALLHDVGKSLGQPLIHRVLIVLLAHFWPALLTKLASAPLACVAWRRPFVIHQLHPEIGATWAEDAGCEETVIKLINIHQHQPATHPQTILEHYHHLLYKADNSN